MDRRKLAGLIRDNRGVLTRRVLRGAGVSDQTIGRRVRDGEWQKVFPGVYFASSDLPDFDQRVRCVRAWIGPSAAFCLDSAAYLHGIIREPPAVIDVVVSPGSGHRSRDRCRVYRRAGVLITADEPQRTTLEQTIVDLIDIAPSEVQALEILMRGIQHGADLTVVTTLIENTARLRHRAFVNGLLAIASDGVESHLELHYRRKVERAHGLPRGKRQKWERIRDRWIRSDCIYEDYGVRAELDGELAHPGRATDSDILRDNDVRTALDEITLRYRWRHVMFSPCLVAAQVAYALRLRGWRGKVRSCGASCEVHREMKAIERRVA